MLDAIAQAARVSPARARRAAMLCGDLGRVTTIALTEGAEGLASVGLTLLRPIRPMLAEPAGGLDVDGLRRELPLTPFFFDCLQRGGSLLIDAPARERFLALGEALPDRCQVPRLVPRDAAEAGAFLDRALCEGHEGLMAKDPEATYQAGGRGASYRPDKRASDADTMGTVRALFRRQVAYGGAAGTGAG
jgi:ATP-dependent DNA ligase